MAGVRAATVNPGDADVDGGCLDREEDTKLRVTLKDGGVTCSPSWFASLCKRFQDMVPTARGEQPAHVALPEVSLSVWDCIVCCHTRGRKPTTETNFEDALEVARLYDMKHLLDLCHIWFTAENINPDEVGTWENFVRKYQLHMGSRQIVELFCEHFVPWRNSKKLQLLSKNDWLDIFSNPRLLATEDHLYEALLTWLKDRREDEATTIELFQRIRLGDVSVNCLKTNEEASAPFREIGAISQMFEEEKKIRRMCLFGEPEFDPYERNKEISPEDLVVVGHNDNVLALVYSKRLSRTQNFGLLYDAGVGFAATLCENRIYITGGDECCYTYFFNIITKSWLSGPLLLERRADHGMTTIGNKVYAVAGQFESVPRSTIEEHKCGSQEWLCVGNLPQATSDCGVASVGDLIVVAGGQGCDQLVQTFDVTTKCAVTHPLIMSLHRPYGVSIGDEAVFLDTRGNLLRVDKKDRVEKPAFVELPPYTADIRVVVKDGVMTVVDEDRADILTGCTLNGDKVDSTLPINYLLTVYGVFYVNLPLY